VDIIGTGICLGNLFTNEPVFRSFKLYKTSFGKLPAEVFSGVFALQEKLYHLAVKRTVTITHNKWFILTNPLIIMNFLI
jgi:hypothetical protein